MHTQAAETGSAKIADALAQRVGEMEHGDKRQAGHNLGLDLRLVSCKAGRAGGPIPFKAHAEARIRPIPDSTV